MSCRSSAMSLVCVKDHPLSSAHVLYVFAVLLQMAIFLHMDIYVYMHIYIYIYIIYVYISICHAIPLPYFQQHAMNWIVLL